MRRDILERPADRPEQWKVSTRLSEDKAPMISYFTDKGQLLRTEMSDGSYWEPTSLQELAKLWKSKGLPVD